MNAQTFKQPVSVLVGLGFARTIPNVMAAYQLVAEWPASPRSTVHLAALDACRACLKGEGKMEDARLAFLDFADRTGILMADATPVVRSQTTPRVSTPRLT